MIEFKTIQSLKPNTEILEVIKDYKYKIQKRQDKWIFSDIVIILI